MAARPGRRNVLLKNFKEVYKMCGIINENKRRELSIYSHHAKFQLCRKRWENVFEEYG